MRESSGDIWSMLGNCDALCITTNRIVKNNGALVMNAGIALQAKLRYPEIQYTWGTAVKRYGNIPCIGIIDKSGTNIVSFPTKNDYRDPSDFMLIANSARLLVDIANRFNWRNIILPRPDCGIEGLLWNNIYKILEPIFDSRFEVWTF